MRPIPQIAIDFVADHEGLRLKAYQDVAGIWTIGYGHIDGVKVGDLCNKSQAVAWLAQDLQIAAQKLYGVIKADIIETCLSEQQWAALLSFTFNVGAGASWQIWKLINAKKFDQAADQLSRFINANGQQVAGLAKRRADEFALWHSGAPVAEVPSSVTRGEGVTPPTPATKKPLWMSKTLWTGGGVTAAGVVNGAQTVQGIAAPQAYHSPWLGKLVGLTAILIVIGGVLIVFFKAMEQRAETHQ